MNIAKAKRAGVGFFDVPHIVRFCTHLTALRRTAKDPIKVNLTAAEILILKELKGAGGRGRNFDRRSSELERLVGASYVISRKGTATRYVITDNTVSE